MRITQVLPDDRRIGKEDIKKAFEDVLKGIPLGLIGCVSEGNDFKVFGLNGKICVETDINDLKEAWQRPLRW